MAATSAGSSWRGEVAVVAADQLDAWVVRGDPGHRGSQTSSRRAEAVDPVAVLVAAAEHPEHQVDPGDALGQGPAEEPAGPDHGDAVGQDQVAGEHVGAERRVAPHVHELGRVDHADAQPAAAAMASSTRSSTSLHRQGVDGHAEELLPGARRGCGVIAVARSPTGPRGPRPRVEQPAQVVRTVLVVDGARREQRCRGPGTRKAGWRRLAAA